MDNSVSIVIPAYNCEDTIEETLRAVLCQSYPEKAEIIVVDDGSTDKTPTVIQSFADVAYFRQDNAGPAAARNNGFRRARGDIVFFTDSDCVPAHDWVEKGLIHFSNPQVAVVAGSYGIINSDSLLARCIHKEIIFRHKKLMPEYPKYFGSYNFCARKKVLNEVGGFDTSYRCASGEDNDLSYKILKAGYKIYFEKESIVSHYHPSSLKKYLHEQFRHGFWRVKMYRDHPYMARGDDYTFWKDILEPPIALLLVASLFFSFFVGIFWYVTAIQLLLLLLIELLYSACITRTASETFFYSFVMILRAFFRTAGFVAGILIFLPGNPPKKSK